MKQGTRKSTVVLAASAAFLLLADLALAGGICNVRYVTKNKSRYVHGPVDEECGISEPNSPPFGNWGVETESTERSDGQQFQGWCHNQWLTDNDGNTEKYCKDGWYEWNSCTTTLARFRPPNHHFYNHEDGTEQKSRYTDDNIHGSGSLNLGVSCPVDTDGDFHADRGGCQDVLDIGFRISGHRMTLYEMDHGLGDDKVGTLKFPTLHASVSGLDCSLYECGKGRDGTYRSKSSGSIRSVSAKAAIQITSAVFENAFGSCCDPLSDPGCHQ